ncbi:TonB-dependent receptor [Nitrospirillum sp. BR 11752]|uniref:TonB-dependent receptor n=1 Tax=Nitrospirillum sp. BR 11752 TaxID=3104293 RepID=UPI002E9B8A28|nr:TonB-dependent receptor [Nitrospirillum sp. BR 11752]
MRAKTSYSYILLAMTALSWSPLGAALAAGADDAASRAAPAAASGVEAGSEGLDDIIVTGEKTNRTLKETTASVAVTTAARIAQENIQTIQDIYDRTANLSQTYGASGFTIRGIGNTGVSNAGNADAATVYVDGAPIPSAALFGGPTGMWDVSQVEILRGPQSTLQGLNAMAGAVVITTRDPSLDHWTGDARVQWTDQQERTFSAAAGGPLVTDELGLRVSAERRVNDGIIKNVVLDDHEDALRSLNLRGKLKWTPKALPDLTAVLSYDRARRDGGYLYQYVRTDVPDYYDHRTSFSNRPNIGKVDTDIATLNLSYRLSDTLTLTNVASWNRLKQDASQDSDGTPQDLQVVDNKTKATTYTEELRLNYQDERFSGLLGGWYYNRDLTVDADSHVTVTTPLTTITNLLRSGGFPAATASAISAAYGKVLPEIPVAYTSHQPQQVETAALFGDGRYRLTDQLSLLAGFRYDHEQNRYGAGTVTQFTGTYPDPAAFGAAGTPLNLAIQAINRGVAGIVSQASSAAASNQRTFDAFLPKAGVSMDWTPDLVTAFTVQRGYRSGGSSQNAAHATLVPYDPEYSWNYEGSVRSTWLGGSLAVNANAFYTDWSDQQVTARFSDNVYDYNTVNAGKSHLYGFELETTHKISPVVDWYASLGYLRTKFDELHIPNGGSATVDLTGSQFPYAPHWTVAGGVNLHFGEGFVANLNANWRDAVFTVIGTNQSQSRVDARTIVNTRVGYDAGLWGAYLFVNNLTDEHYADYLLTSQNRAIIGAPRTIGGSVEVHW